MTLFESSYQKDQEKYFNPQTFVKVFSKYCYIMLGIIYIWVEYNIMLYYNMSQLYYKEKEYAGIY